MHHRQDHGAKIFFLALLLLAGIVISHSILCFQAIEVYNRLGNDSPYGAFGRPIPAPLNRSAFIDGDCYLWNQYAATIARGERLRVRSNERDNAPFGRDVHWNTGYSYLLAGSGWVWKLLAGVGIEEGIEKASTVVNPLLFLAFLATAGLVTARSFGYPAAALLILAAGGSHQIYWLFFPGKPDHHGLIAIAAFGTLACLVAGGGGWVRENCRTGGGGGSTALLPDRREAARWFAASAAFGGVGFWTSALTQSLLTAMICVGAAVASLFVDRGKAADGISYRHDLWRLWGRVGAAAIIFFYLLEYFPGHFSMSIEINHPVYALAWWGGAELLASVLKWRRGTLRSFGGKDWLLAGLAAGAAAILPLLLWFGGDRYYRPLDPFFVRVAPYIIEQTPLRVAAFVRDFGLLAAAALASFLLLLYRGPGRESRFPLSMLLVVTAMSLGLTLWYKRWAFLFAVSLVLLLVYCLLQHGRTKERSAAGWVALLLAGTLLSLQFCAFGFQELKRGVHFRRADSNEFNMIHFAWLRHIAEAIRADSRGREVVVLSDPGTGLVLSHFGGFSTIGSLYWENIAGLKAAADIFTAKSDAEAYRLVRQRGVTHIVLFKAYEPSKRFHEMKYGSYGPEAYRTFGSKVRVRLLPPWLKQIPLYPTAGEFKRLHVDVFKVVPS